MTVTDEEDTMALCATTAEPISPHVVDLDAGTTLPRVVSLGATLLVAAALVATIFGGPPGGSAPLPTSMSPVSAPGITAPAWRTTWAGFSNDARPAWPVGPAALVDDAIARAIGR